MCFLSLFRVHNIYCRLMVYIILIYMQFHLPITVCLILVSMELVPVSHQLTCAPVFLRMFILESTAQWVRKSACSVRGHG